MPKKKLIYIESNMRFEIGGLFGKVELFLKILLQIDEKSMKNCIREKVYSMGSAKLPARRKTQYMGQVCRKNLKRKELQ